jgi:hypothetical protein
MDFQFLGLFVGIVGLDFDWGVRENGRFRPRARMGLTTRRSHGALVLCALIFLCLFAAISERVSHARLSANRC